MSADPSKKAFRLWSARLEVDAHAAQLKWVPMADLPRETATLPRKESLPMPPSRIAVDSALGRIQRAGHAAIVTAKKLKPEDGSNGPEMEALILLVQELAAAVLVLGKELEK
jgi:hypothetical protein